MIEKSRIQKIVENKIEGTDLFIVDVKIDVSNNILVFLDGDKGISIDKCVEISKHIESLLDRDVEDFFLEVSSAGIGCDFKVHRQYVKSIGKSISVLFKNGMKLEGVLTRVDDDGFDLNYIKKEKLEGAKRPKMVNKTDSIKFDEIKSVKEIIVI